MRKTLLSLFMLLLGVGNLWAGDITVSQTDRIRGLGGKYYTMHYAFTNGNYPVVVSGTDVRCSNSTSATPAIFYLAPEDENGLYKIKYLSTSIYWWNFDANISTNASDATSIQIFAGETSGQYRICGLSSGKDSNSRCYVGKADGKTLNYYSRDWASGSTSGTIYVESGVASGTYCTEVVLEEVKDPNVAIATTLITSGWYQVRTSTGGSNHVMTDNFITTQDEEYEGGYPAKSAAMGENRPATFLYFDVKANAGNTGKQISVKNAKGRYMTTTATSSFEEPTANIFAIYSTNTATSKLVITNAASGNTRKSWKVLDNYIGVGSANEYPVFYACPIGEAYTGNAYIVDIAIAKESETLTYNGDAANINNGFASVFDNGTFFFAPGVTPSPSDFSFSGSENAQITVDTENKIIRVNNVPIKGTSIVDGEFAEGTKWYRMSMRTTKFCQADIVDSKVYMSNSYSAKNNASFFAFVPVEEVENGYKIYNYAMGADKSLYTTGANSNVCSYASEGTTFILERSKYIGHDGFLFRVNGQSNAYLDNGDTEKVLHVWNPSNATPASTEGSTIVFHEVSDEDWAVAATLPKAGKFYTIFEPSSRQYLVSDMSTVSGQTSNLAMSTSPAEGSNLFYFTGAHLMSYDKGLYLNKNNNGLGFFNLANVGSVGTLVNFLPQSDGKFTLEYNDARTFYGKYTGYCSGAGSENNGDGYLINVNEVTSLPLQTNVDGYTSFSAPVPVTIPDNCYAYTAVDKGDGVVNMKKVTGDVAAYTGLILKTENGAEDLSFSIPETGDIVEGNILKANVAKANVAKADNYFFGKYAGSYVFTKISGDDNFELSAHKAYINGSSLSEGAARLSIVWGDEIETAINDIRNESNGLSDGKIVVDGKLVIIKNGLKYSVSGVQIK